MGNNEILRNLDVGSEVWVKASKIGNLDGQMVVDIAGANVAVLYKNITCDAIEVFEGLQNKQAPQFDMARAIEDLKYECLLFQYLDGTWGVRQFVSQNYHVVAGIDRFMISDMYEKHFGKVPL